MDIKITESLLRKFLKTTVTAEEIASMVSLCGPTFDRIHKTDGDFIYEIESITNRVDTTCALGIARDSAIILKQFDCNAELINDPYKIKPDSYTNIGTSPNIQISAKELVKRFVAVSIKNINVHNSPKETEQLLINCGQRSINNVVDITNEITLLYGIPCHIFDQDKLALQKLELRLSKKGEIISTLDGKDNILNGDDLVIEDGQGRLVDLCGIMGGSIAEVDSHTKNILFIIPICDYKKVRKTSLYTQKRTVAAQILEKQPDAKIALTVLNLAMKMFFDRAGGQVASQVFDYYPNPSEDKIVNIDLIWLNKIIGIELSLDKVEQILNGLGFKVEVSGNTISCLIPSWRYHDINIPEDLVEEIARVYGYFRLPSIIPITSTPPESKNLLLDLEYEAKQFLSSLGFTEIYNNSLISRGLINKSESNIEVFEKLRNSLTEDFEYLRIQLAPSLIQNFSHNLGHPGNTLGFYELSNVYHKKSGEFLPDEISNLSIVSNENYLSLKGYIEMLFKKLMVRNYTFTSVISEIPPYFQKTQTAEIKINNQPIGYLGVVKPSILRKFNIENDIVIFEINFTRTSKLSTQKYIYNPISTFPYIIDDITLTSDLPISEAMDCIKKSSDLIIDIEYQQSYKNNHTFRVSFGSLSKNLTQLEVDLVKKSILQIFTK